MSALILNTVNSYQSKTFEKNISLCIILVRNVRINMICVLHGVKWEKRLSEQKQFVIDQMKNHSSNI